jgi:hypothetical protein
MLSRLGPNLDTPNHTQSLALVQVLVLLQYTAVVLCRTARLDMAWHTTLHERHLYGARAAKAWAHRQHTLLK